MREAKIEKGIGDFMVRLQLNVLSDFHYPRLFNLFNLCFIRYKIQIADFN